MTWRTPAALLLLPLLALGTIAAIRSAAFADEVEIQEAQAEAEAAEADEPAQAKPAAPNPLGNLIRRIFGGPNGGNNPRAPQNPDTPDDPANQPANGDTTARDQVDARAPHDPSQAKELRQAATHIQNGEHRQAMERLQRLLDRSDDSLVRLPNGKWVSVRHEANRILGELPAELLETYRLQYGVFARSLLEEAQKEHNLTRLADVAGRYFHTEAGQHAANHLGTMHFDRGEFGMAARWFEQLVTVRSPIARDPRWRLKAAFALRQSGNVAAGEKIIRDLQSEGLLKGLQLGGAPVNADSWLTQSHLAPKGAASLDDWPLFYGSADRTGTATGGEPLLLPRWSQPLTSSQPTRELIGMMSEDLADQQRAAIPAFFPLMVDGKVVFRTLRGVQVVDAEKGTSLWETREGVSAEQILNGLPGQDEDFRVARQVFIQQYHGQNADQHQLTSLLFRDGTYGIISSDGRQLFAIEDHAMMSRHHYGYNAWGGFDPGQNDPHFRNWSSNKIVAYDLSNGRPRWEIGGVAMDEPFDLPLAGTYFFGTPTPDGDELYVVGEKDQQIRLYALDAQTGHPRWDQLLAFSDVKIEQDLGRRLWTSQVSISNGVIVCPTTVGWLVGVDRLNHAVLWAHRYSKPSREQQRRQRGLSMSQPGDLNSRWAPSAPVLVGNRVLFTPSEDPTLVCLDLFDGTQHWQTPKGDHLYLATTHNGRAILVGKQSVTALAIDNGKTVWTLPIAGSDGRPSGVGVAVEGHYHLPLGSGQLWTIDLAKGKVLAKSWLSDSQEPLGNLALYRGMLLSQGPQGLTSFEQREAVESEIRRRKEANPRDSWALLREADIQLLNRDHSAALASLRAIDAENVPDELVARYRASMIETLSTMIRGDFAGRDREHQELAKFVESDEESLHFRRLSAERLHARKEYRAAFDLYWDLASQSVEEPITVASPFPVTLGFDRWLTGRLADLWIELPENDRADLAARIETAAGELGANNRRGRERFALLFGFHPSAVKIEQQLAEAAAKAGDFPRAESLLLDLARNGDSEVASQALADLGNLMAAAGLPRDAGRYYERLTSQNANATLADGRTARETVEALLADGIIARPQTARTASWGDGGLQLVRSGMNYDANEVQDLGEMQSDAPFFRDHRLEIHHQHQRLAVIGGDNDELHWLLPLRSSARSMQGNYSAVRSSGHLLFLLHRDVLHALSPVDRRVLWTKPLESRGQAAGGNRVPVRRSQQRALLQPTSNLSGQNVLTLEATSSGLMPVANSDYVCVYGRRDFSVLDALTGEIRWTCSDIPPNTLLFGNAQVLFVVPPDRTKTTALRPLDGKPLALPAPETLMARAIRFVERGLVLVEQTGTGGLLGLSKPEMTVRLHDPLTGRDHWKASFPHNSTAALVDDRTLLVLDAEGQPSLLDFDSGRTVTFDQAIAAGSRRSGSYHALADEHRVYILANNPNRRGYYYSENLPSVQVNGDITVYDRHTGKRLWQQKVTAQNLLQQHFHHSPILTFAARNYVRKGQMAYGTVTVVAIDKNTGRKLVDHTIPSNSGFRALDINMTERYVELSSYNERIRLVVDDSPATAERP